MYVAVHYLAQLSACPGEVQFLVGRRFNVVVKAEVNGVELHETVEVDGAVRFIWEFFRHDCYTCTLMPFLEIFEANKLQT